MTKYLIGGGNELFGEVRVQRAKNSVLTLIAASALVRGKVRIVGCPRINDVFVMVRILEKIGAKCDFSESGLTIDSAGIFSTTLPDKAAGEVRASFFITGALLSRFKTAKVARPGGCNIGSRPIDIHLEGLAALGVECCEEDRRLSFYAKKLEGTRFRLKYPSVGATENLIMAATLAQGTTVLENCAREPEVKDLQDFLNMCGANITGAGTSKVTVRGVKALHGGTEFVPVADRIEAGTFLLAALSSGGELSVKGIKSEIIAPLLKKIKNNACKLYIDSDNIYIKATGSPISFGNVVTAPYPLYPTDLQPQLTAVAAAAHGRTVVTETVFDNRFRFIEELEKMGADITVAGDTAVIRGGKLFGSQVCAKDLRGGAALTIAALSAEGETVLSGVENLERGYEDFYEKLTGIGADIRRR